jgi:CRP/FNR family cyclic AMP-dependent transcriptional regulator
VAKTYGKGTTIMREGEPGSSLMMLVSGKVKVFVSEPGGRDYILATLGPGEYVGELALLDDEPRTASVQTEEACSLLILHKRDFLKFLSDNPFVQHKLLVNLAKRSRHLTETAKSLALRDVYTRVRMLFEDLAVEHDGRMMINRPMTQQAIADRVGSSREMIARILKELVFGGYVRIEKRHVVICRKIPEAF